PVRAHDQRGPRPAGVRPRLRGCGSASPVDQAGHRPVISPVRRGRLPRLVALAALALAAVALVGCSDEAAANASPVATTSVELPKSYKFVPAAIVVEVGDT